MNPNLSSVLGYWSYAQGWAGGTRLLNVDKTCVCFYPRISLPINITTKALITLIKVDLRKHKTSGDEGQSKQACQVGDIFGWGMCTPHHFSLFDTDFFAAFCSNRLSWQKWFVINGGFVTHLYPWTLTRPINSSACGPLCVLAFSLTAAQSWVPSQLTTRALKQWLKL